jgi:ribosomal protein S18 acetylase RimI-like enzyme
MTRCDVCGAAAHYRDRSSGKSLCPAHARWEVTSSQRRREPPGQGGPLAIRPATEGDAAAMQALARHFWGETVVDCFDRQYDIGAGPAFVACEGDLVVGVAAYAVETGWDAAVLVMLNVLPEQQGRGGGRALLEAVCGEARRQGLGRVWVATSNDDLPALGFYQQHGFRITKLIPGRIAEHHGREEVGFGGLPVRDEIRLEREVGG